MTDKVQDHDNPILSSNVQDMIATTPEATQFLSKLDLGALWQWILCFSVVTFDLDFGHSLECSFPPIPFSKEEEKTLCFSAFPDSNSISHSGDSVFTFRMRNGEFTKKLYRRQPQTCDFTEQGAFDKANLTGLPIDNDGYTYGYVFFRQQRNSNIRRGFFQKAVILLSPHAWHGLFSVIIGKIGPKIMNDISKQCKSLDEVKDQKKIELPRTISELLESSCLEICDWPSPPSSWSSELAFEPINIPVQFFEDTILVSFPPYDTFPQVYYTRFKANPNYYLNGMPILTNPGKFYQLYHKSLDLLWPAWELVLLGEPLAILADSPNSCSHVVLSLIELIKPIPFGGDYRPFFTIQDPDFARLTSKSNLPHQAIILGTTNKIFKEVLSHWPNIIYTGKLSICPNPNAIPGLGFLSMNSHWFPDHDAAIEACSFKHRSFFSCDKKILKTILEVGVNVLGVEGINNMIRQHFVEMTKRFIHPLNRYFESLAVGSASRMSLGNLSPEPIIKPFRQDEFLATIENSIPTFPVANKRPIIDFYRQFLSSTNFTSWLQHRTGQFYRQWRGAYLDILCNGDIRKWLNNDFNANPKELLSKVKAELERYAPFFVVEGDQVKIAYLSKKSAEIEPIVDAVEEIGVDLSSMRMEKHLRIRTTPITSRSTLPRGRKMSFSEDKTRDRPPLTKDPSAFIEQLKLESKDTNSLRALGEFIPSVQQYTSLLSQFKFLLDYINSVHVY